MGREGKGDWGGHVDGDRSQPKLASAEGWGHQEFGPSWPAVPLDIRLHSSPCFSMTLRLANVATFPFPGLFNRVQWGWAQAGTGDGT